MSKKIKLGFADTHEHISQFFHSLLANRFDVEIDNENPDYLIFRRRLQAKRVIRKKSIIIFSFDYYVIS
jgi:hypothetical protein